jgi:hypothetical protein
MTPLECPKCGQFVSDRALDDGQCPSCGYDGAMVGAASPKRAWLVATAVVVIGGAALGAYLLIPRAETIRLHGPEIAAIKPAPASHPQPIPAGPELAPLPRAVVAQPPPSPVVAAPPKQNRPAPAIVGPIRQIDPRAVRDTHIDSPDGAVLVSDMNRDGRLTLTGKVRQMRIGSVGGSAILDASGLTAQEIIVTGDLHGRATLKLNAPDGSVTISGHVEGSARVIVDAPRGEVIVSAGSGRLDGESELTVTARSVEVKGAMAGNARLIVTLTGGGAVTLGTMHENASVVYVPNTRP